MLFFSFSLKCITSEVEFMCAKTSSIMKVEKKSYINNSGYLVWNTGANKCVILINKINSLFFPLTLKDETSVIECTCISFHKYEGWKVQLYRQLFEYLISNTG